MPARQPKRGRLWFNDGSCIRLRPRYRNHVWAYDFVFDRTGDGRQLKFLRVVDEYSRQDRICPCAVSESAELALSGGITWDLHFWALFPFYTVGLQWFSYLET